MQGAHFRSLLLASAVAVLSACGGGNADLPPAAKPASYWGREDRAIPLQLSGSDPEGAPLVYEVVRQPDNGAVLLAGATGQGEYFPAADYHGRDSFWYVVRTPNGVSSAPVEVVLMIERVNDPPTISAPAYATNSAYSYISPVEIAVFDVDGDALQYSATIEPADVADMELDRAGSRLLLRPLRRGAATIVLQATDGTLTSRAEIAFEVADVRREQTMLALDPLARAVTIRNPRSEPLVFRLEHNGFRSFGTLGEVADHVRAIPAAYLGETFGAKLWRFVRDNVAHDYPLSQEQWFYDPLVTLNSIGWGLCSNVASLYVRVARAAGYEARVWGLGGHVVPEIFEDGRWQMFDPDLAVFYFGRDGLIAGVEQLASDPSLLYSPIDALHEPQVYDLPYNIVVTDIYASTADNAVDNWYDGPDRPLDGAIRLPPGASLTYPGVWHAPPTGYDGFTAQAITGFRHAVMDIPAGYQGAVSLPWLLVAIQGDGLIRMGGMEYKVGDTALRDEFLQPTRIHHALEVVSSRGGVRLVFLVNAGRFAMKPETQVAVTGMEVWALEIKSVELPTENRASPAGAFPPVKPGSRLEPDGLRRGGLQAIAAGAGTRTIRH